MALKAIVNGAVVTMDPERRVLDDGVILIEDHHISAVGEASDVEIPGDAEVIDGSHMAVLPGLINGHTHVPHTLLRGLAANQDRRVLDWLTNVVHPGIAAYELSDISVAVRLYCVEAIRSGITCLVDNLEGWPDQTLEAGRQVVDAYTEAGVRAMIARMMFDRQPDAMAERVRTLKAMEPDVVHAEIWRPTEMLLSDVERLIRTYNGTADGRIQVWPAPVGTLMSSERVHRASQRLARDNGTMWTLHLVQAPEPEHGTASSTQFLHDKGLLDDRLLASHCVNLDRHDIELLRAAGVKGCTQVASNASMAMGIAPVPALIRAGVPVGVGTDDVNCNQSVNLLSDMRVLAMVHRTLNDDPSVLTPETILEMATINGARGVGMENEIGSIEVGKRADVILIDLQHAQTTPTHHIPTAIVFQTYGNEVDTVIIDGRVVMRSRQLTWLTPPEERDLYRDASERSSAIAARAGIRTNRSWANVPT